MAIELKSDTIRVKINGTKLPDGQHEGTWGGYVLKFKAGKFDVEVDTANGVRTMAAPVIVTIKDGQISAKLKNRQGE